MRLTRSGRREGPRSTTPCSARCRRSTAATGSAPRCSIISDGADTASDATLRDVRAALLRSDAFVYAIAIDSPEAAMPINTRVNPAALNEITSQSGGRTEVVHDAEGLLAATAHIAEELNSQYVLGYSSPKSTDGKFHSIRVSMRDPAMRVRARNGYVGTPISKPR